jgi:hypothetical protein
MAIRGRGSLLDGRVGTDLEERVQDCPEGQADVFSGKIV